jgi:prepilin peptidase CpaA
MSPQTVLVLLVTLVCSYTDWRKGLVYNALTYPAAAAGILLSFLYAPPDPFLSAAGLVASLFGFGLLWFIGGMGAGDVKLLAAVGALKGLPFILNASVYLLFVASMAGIVVLAARGKLPRTIKWIALVFVSLLVPGMSRPALEGEKTHMPFAPFIFVGVVIAVYLEFANGPFTL